ncbi:MAG: SAM-dependent methyltransferase [Sulfitobacter sp.]
MTSPQNLIDRNALSLHRKRASADALFLQRAAVDEVQDRLLMVNRAFKSPAIVTPFAQIWEDVIPGATIVPDDDTLALTPGAHDLVIHALGLHWANDPIGQLIQCKRALMPDGLMIAAGLGGQTLHELRSCLAQAEIAISGGLSPRVAPMADLRDLGALLQRAGLALPVADRVTLPVQYASALHLMRDLRAMGETNALTARPGRPTKRALIDETNRLYQSHFATDKGRIAATFEILFLTGWAPSDSQPKPLRPGSASQRLSDALSTTENPLPD